MPKVSVIIPVYNVEKYLRVCLDSVVNQTLKDIEIICVNDGSTDDSLQILQEYAAKDSRIKIINKENGGYGKAMNVGLDNTTGEYIGIVEPDDYIELNMYETLYNIAQKNDLDIIKSDFYSFTGSGETFEKFYNKIDENDKYYNKVVNPQKDFNIFHVRMHTWTGIYKKEFLKQHNIRYNETPGASYQDNGFWLKTFMHAERVYFLNQAFYMYRRDNENASIKNKGKVYAMATEYNLIWDYICANDDLKKKFSGVYFDARFSNCIWNYHRIDDSLKLEYIEFISKEFNDFKKSGVLSLETFIKKNKRILNGVMRNPRKFNNRLFTGKSFVETLFSLKNQDGYKYLTILGFEIKLKPAKNTPLGRREMKK